MARFKDKDGTPAWKWKTKSSNVQIANLDPTLIKYFDSLEPEFQNLIIATAGTNGKHTTNSRHYSNKGVDLKLNDALYKRVKNDPNRIKMGITLLDPNHGVASGKSTAPHFHFSVGNGTENKNDVWMDPHSDKAKKFIDSAGIQHSEDDGHDHQHESQPQQVMGAGDNYAAQQELIKSLMGQLQQDSELDAIQKQMIAQEQEKQQFLIKRTEERNNILDAIGQNSLEFQGRKFRPNAEFEEGGIVDDLDSDTQFMINNLKSQTPVIESPQYLQLVQENEALQNKIKSTTSLLGMASSSIAPSANPSNESQGITENVQSSEAAVAPKISNVNPTKQLLFSELSTLGLNKNQVAGIIGSLGGESHEELSTTAENPTSKAFGIAQWYKSRLAGLKNFADSKGLDFKSPEAQVQFLVHELKGTHKHVLKHMLNTKNVQEATETWTRKFEIPSEKEIRHSLGRRINFAQNFLNTIS